ncbi:uncharacterized protein [Argopecten irradians]|uniref:uncharacterized protein n=1 Tax=Argopecten irradians TaxID=31199 RepID=UPI0037237589
MALYQVVLLASFLYMTSGQSSPIVETPSGPIKGIVVPALGKDTVQFRNIPYAKPPVGDLRFEKTVPIEPWTETLDGTVFGPSCIQDTRALPELWKYAYNNITSEDCLQLNVYVPGSVSTATKKPVMFWIHGGGFQIGNGWSADPSFLVLKDVIVVTINYRLGVFGFLSTGDSSLPGNYGLWDMIEALKWVNKNIASFGGDPGKVTIFGESAGGFSVSYMSVIPSNEGLFQKVIYQSGSAVCDMWDVSNPFKFTKAIGKHVGCITENDSTINKDAMVACLKEISTDDLFAAQTDPSIMEWEEIPMTAILFPTIDGELLVRSPLQSLEDTTSKESEFFRSLDVMAGTTDNEASIFPYILMRLQESRNFNLSEGIPNSILCNDLAPAIARAGFKDDAIAPELLCQAYTREDLAEQSQSTCDLWGDMAFVAPTVQLLDFHSRGKPNPNTYQYLFTQTISFHFMVPSYSWSKGVGHGTELLYLFGPDLMNKLDESLSSPEGRKLSEILASYWTNFAKTGNPNGDNLVEWKSFGSDARYFMNLNVEPFLDKDAFGNRMKLLLEDIPNKLKKRAKTELSHDCNIDIAFRAIRKYSWKNRRQNVRVPIRQVLGFWIKKSHVTTAMALYQVVLLATFLIMTSGQSSPIVETPSGPIKGIVVSALGKDTVQFRNIPYAKPPVGDLRFEKTVPIEPWTDTLDGTMFGPSCIQDTRMFADFQEYAYNNITSEDCLQLNVYVPGSVSTATKKPVMFWIHGGGYMIGNGWSFDPSFLVLKDVIVVTINYRLGVFGFLSTGDDSLPGNYGLWDMIEALKWVNKNIASFGGDPGKVTIFGESAGGLSVSFLSVIPSNDGLFQRIIPQSGSAITQFWDPIESFTVAKRFGNHVGCITENDSIVHKDALVACLKEIPADDLFAAQIDPSNMYFEEIPLSPVFWPTIDGEMFVRSPLQSLEDPTSKESVFFRSLDVMAGTTDNEGSIFPFLMIGLQESRNFNFSEGIPTSVVCNDLAPAMARAGFKDDAIAPELLCQAYKEDNLAEQSRSACNMWGDLGFVAPTVQLLDFHSRGKSNPNTYQYLFTQAISFHFLVPSFSWSKGAGHGVELLYLSGPDLLNTMEESLYSPEGRKLSDTLATYWTNFAKSGNPNGNNIMEWKSFGSDARYFMNLNVEPFLDKDAFGNRMKLLLEDIPNKLKKRAKTEL